MHTNLVSLRNVATVLFAKWCCWSLEHSSCCLHIEMHFSEGRHQWTAAIRSRLSSSSLIKIKAHVCTENWKMCKRYARHELVRLNVRWNIKSKYHVEYLVFSYKLLFSELNDVFNGIIEGWGFRSKCLWMKEKWLFGFKHIHTSYTWLYSLDHKYSFSNLTLT